MAKMTLIPAQTAAVATAVLFDSGPTRAKDVVFIASALATTEEVDIQMYAGNDTWITYDVSGTPVTLTASQPHATLPAGPLYRVLKDETASACAVIVSWAPGSTRN